MGALTIEPGRAGSARVRDVPEPDPGDGSVLGHESLGRFLEAPPGSDVGRGDLVVECTGAPHLVADVLQHNGPGGIVCLTGVSRGRQLTLDLGGLIRMIVLRNDVLFGDIKVALDQSGERASWPG